MDFIEENYRELLKFAVRLTGNLADSEDVLQTVAVNICRRQDELGDIEYCKTYLMTCIRNSSLNVLRTKSRQRRANEDFDVVQSTVPDPKSAEAYEYIEWVESLERHLSVYDEASRKAFFAYYIDREPLGDVAASLRLTKRQTTKKFESMRMYLKRHYKHLFVQLSVLMSM